MTITQKLMKLKRKLLIILMINILLLQNLISYAEIFALRLKRVKWIKWIKNELNELSKKVKAISTKGLAKDLIHKLSILNGVKYFFQ